MWGRHKNHTRTDVTRYCFHMHSKHEPKCHTSQSIQNTTPAEQPIGSFSLQIMQSIPSSLSKSESWNRCLQRLGRPRVLEPSSFSSLADSSCIGSFRRALLVCASSLRVFYLGMLLFLLLFFLLFLRSSSFSFVGILQSSSAFSW